MKKSQILEWKGTPLKFVLLGDSLMYLSKQKWFIGLQCSQYCLTTIQTILKWLPIYLIHIITFISRGIKVLSYHEKSATKSTIKLVERWVYNLSPSKCSRARISNQKKKEKTLHLKKNIQHRASQILIDKRRLPPFASIIWIRSNLMLLHSL